MGTGVAGLEELVVRTVRKYYPRAHVDRVEVRKGRVVFYGMADERLWFKVIVGVRSGDIRVFSPSRTIEIALRRSLAGRIVVDEQGRRPLQEKDKRLHGGPC